MDQIAVAIAEVSFPDDLATIAAIDTAFVATEMLALESAEREFRFSPRALDRPLQKSFQLDDIAQHWDASLVASLGARKVGVAFGEFEAWNRRFVVSHFYVDRQHRNRGVGTALMEAMVQRATLLDADHLWIETNNFNIPAIAAYRRWGFEMCGLDTSLYSGTDERGEVAIFLSRSL